MNWTWHTSSRYLYKSLSVLMKASLVQTLTQAGKLFLKYRVDPSNTLHTVTRVCDICNAKYKTHNKYSIHKIRGTLSSIRPYNKNIVICIFVCVIFYQYTFLIRNYFPSNIIFIYYLLHLCLIH